MKKPLPPGKDYKIAPQLIYICTAVWALTDSAERIGGVSAACTFYAYSSVGVPHKFILAGLTEAMATHLERKWKSSLTQELPDSFSVCDSHR